MRKINLYISGQKAAPFKRVTAAALILLFAVQISATLLYSQENSVAESTNTLFRAEELDQMLAPIALYTDALLAQILTAATYPLDIVAADRFAKEHPGSKDNALLVEAAKDKDWSPSVKAMLQFPEILAMMDNQLEWTTKLGDAFLAQQRDVMDSIQRLRQKARVQGNLNSNQQEVVKVEPQTQYIIVEQANPQVVYVPVYDSRVVYGVWWYPDYPPYYFPYPLYVGGFFPGFFVDVEWGWGVWGCDWFHRDIIVNVDHYNHFTRHCFDRPERFEIRNTRGNVAWRHNPEFRRSAGYRDYWTAQRFGGRQVSKTATTPTTSTFRRNEQGTTTNIPNRAGGRENVRGTLTTIPGGEKKNVTRIPSTQTGGRENVRGTESPTSMQGRENTGTVRSTSPVTVTTPQTAINIPMQNTVYQPIARPSGGEVSRGRESSTFWSGAGSGGSERAASFRGQSSVQNTGSGVSRGSGGGGGSRGSARGGHR